MYDDTKYSPTKNLKPLNFTKGRTFAPKITPTQDRILPMGKVTYNGGKIKIHMGKILHCGGKILTNKEGFHSLGLFKGPKCHLIRNCYSWPRWNG